MTSETATLIAAIIAAVVSIINLVGGASYRRNEEIRAAIRTAVAANVDSVGRLVHEVIALSFILAKANSDESHKEKHVKARQAADRLKAKRLDVRYSLWGLEEGLRTLTRVPDWVAHTRGNTRHREPLLEAASELGALIDGAVRRTYLTGDAPNWLARWRISRKSTLVKKRFDAFLADEKPD